MTDFQGRTDVEFYATEGPKTFLLSCRPCEGTGKRFDRCLSDLSVWNFEKSTPCQICAGRGVVRLESSDVPIRHNACQGTGRERYEASIQETHAGWPKIKTYFCRGCKGLGIISLMGEIQNLSGKNDDPDGAYAPRKSPELIRPVVYEFEILEHNPIGRWFTTPCRFCEGTGKRPHVISYSLTTVEMGPVPFPCDICKGAMVLRLTSPDLPVVHKECKGTGRARLLELSFEQRRAMVGQELVPGIPMTEPPVIEGWEDKFLFNISSCGGCNGLGIYYNDRKKIEYNEVHFAD